MINISPILINETTTSSVQGTNRVYETITTTANVGPDGTVLPPLNSVNKITYTKSLAYEAENGIPTRGLKLNIIA